MAGRNFGTMSFGYYYDEAKHQGYSVTTENGLYFGNVAYHSKGQLVDALVYCGHRRNKIIIEREIN